MECWVSKQGKKRSFEFVSEKFFEIFSEMKIMVLTFLKKVKSKLNIFPKNFIPFLIWVVGGGAYSAPSPLPSMAYGSRKSDMAERVNQTSLSFSSFLCKQIIEMVEEDGVFTNRQLPTLLGKPPTKNSGMAFCVFLSYCVTTEQPNSKTFR